MLRILALIYLVLLVGCGDGEIQPVVSDQADTATQPSQVDNSNSPLIPVRCRHDQIKNPPVCPAPTPVQ